MSQEFVDVAVIIPAHNVEDYIAQALESVLAQKPSFSRIIVIDDGSTDGTAEVVQRYRRQNVELFQQANAGQSVARNVGLELSSNRFVLFLDADDWLAPGLSHSFEAALANTPQLDMFLFSGASYGGTKEQVCSYNRLYSRFKVSAPCGGTEYLEAELRHSKLAVQPCLYIFKRHLLENDSRLRFDHIIHEDEAFTPELLFRSQVVVVCVEPFYQRRIRQGSTMHRRSRIENVEGYLNAMRYWANKLGSARPESVPLYRERALLMYQLAMTHAGRAKLSFSALRSVICKRHPNIDQPWTLDYLLHRFSISIGRRVITRRIQRNKSPMERTRLPRW